MQRQEFSSSPYNSDPAVSAAFTLPSSIIINDVTLREGEEGADVAFSSNEKVDLARLLDSIGVPQVEIGYAGNSLDCHVISMLRTSGLRAKMQALVQAYQDNWQDQCDRVLDCGADLVGVLLPAGALRLERVHHLTPRQVSERTRQVIEYVVSRGGTAAFIPFDATRAELGFLRGLAKQAADAGASRIVLADTVGGAMPAAIRYLVTEMRQAAPIAVGVHCHNDFGLALANTLAGFEAGASILDASVNGLGDRCGNASLDELAVAIQQLYGKSAGIDLAGLFHLSRQAARLSGMAVPSNKPLVGENGFAVRSDSRLRMLQDHPTIGESIPAELVGNRRTICLGINTGPLSIRCKLNELGLSGSKDQVEQLVAAVRAEATQRRVRLDDEQFIHIFKAIIGSSITKS